MDTPYIPDTAGSVPTEILAQYPPKPAVPNVDNPVNIPATNVPAPTFDPHSQDPEPTAEDKLEYVYQFAKRFDALISSIGPEQIEQVQKIARNPLFSKMFGSK